VIAQRTIGNMKVSAIGLGAMPMSIEGRPEDRQQSIRTIHAALDAGVTLVDTADAYHLYANEIGHNESLVQEALGSWGGDPSSILVATKGGHVRPGDGRWLLDGRPGHLKEAARASARRLGVKAIGLYKLHRPDPDVPYADSVGALADLLDAGTIVRAGISNVSTDQIREANDVLGGRLAAVQNRFSPAFRSSEPELAYCAAQSIAFLPWSPLSGIKNAASLGENFAPFAEMANRYGVSTQVICLAWELAKAEVVIPIPGSSRPDTITDSVTAADLQLTDEDVARLDAVLPVDLD